MNSNFTFLCSLFSEAHFCPTFFNYLSFGFISLGLLTFKYRRKIDDEPPDALKDSIDIQNLHHEYEEFQKFLVDYSESPNIRKLVLDKSYERTEFLRNYIYKYPYDENAKDLLFLFSDI